MLYFRGIYITLIFQFPIYLEPSSQLPIYRELEDEGNFSGHSQGLRCSCPFCWVGVCLVQTSPQEWQEMMIIHRRNEKKPSLVV